MGGWMKADNSDATDSEWPIASWKLRKIIQYNNDS